MNRMLTYLSGEPTRRELWVLTLMLLTLTTFAVAVGAWLASLAGVVTTTAAVVALINRGGPA